MANLENYVFGGYVPASIITKVRTREAIREIRRLPVEQTTKKKLLATWFQQHQRAALQPGAKRAAYLELLGADFYTYMGG